MSADKLPLFYRWWTFNHGTVFHRALEKIIVVDSALHATLGTLSMVQHARTYTLVVVQAYI